jgi:hypothetical protein
MKKVNVKNKLSLDKITISKLKELSEIKGGTIGNSCVVCGPPKSKTACNTLASYCC